MSKTLVVYAKGSIYKFEGVHERYLFCTGDNGLLSVFLIDPETGKDSLNAAFRDWDYFLVLRDEA